MPRQQVSEPVQPSAPGRTFLRLKAVLAKTGLASSSLYDFIEKGAFPKPVPLSERRVRLRPKSRHRPITSSGATAMRGQHTGRKSLSALKEFCRKVIPEMSL